MANSDLKYFKTLEHFKKVIENHDKGKAKLRTWRENFASRSDELAEFVQREMFPGRSNVITRDALVTCFQHELGNRGKQNSFVPWNGRWTGDWENSSGKFKQYHIWDNTVCDDKFSKPSFQYVQPVTQASPGVGNNVKFVIPDKGSYDSKNVDLGINVWSQENGITGWVSKRQNGIQEMPHIAYLINPKTLLWIAQLDFKGDYYMFYETSESSQYSIKGYAFTAQGKFTKKAGIGGGTYYKK